MNSLTDFVVNRLTDVLSDYDILIKSLERYQEVLISEYKQRRSYMVGKEPGSKFLIVGDLHGDLDTLKKILNKVDVSVMKGCKELELTFLGDYIDRGPNQLETILTVLELKAEFPECVTILRGNHEPPPFLIPSPHDFPHELRLLFGYEKGTNIYAKFQELFSSMPLVQYVNKTFVALHGGLPTENYRREVTLVEFFMGVSEDQFNRLLTEILWNDPIDMTNVDRKPSPRGAGYLFGSSVTNWFLGKYNFKFVVRGHEPAYEGFKLNHNGRVVTLFSRVGEPYFNKRAAYMFVDTSAEISLKDIKSYVKVID